MTCTKPAFHTAYLKFLVRDITVILRLRTTTEHFRVTTCQSHVGIGNHTVFLVQFGINLHEWAFWKTHKCKLISNWTRKTVWLLINNTNMKKCTQKNCRKMFLEAIFFAFEKFFFRVSVQNFCHCFTWYHWPTKFALVLHFLHRCHTFCIGVTLELHCSQPIRIE